MQKVNTLVGYIAILAVTVLLSLWYLSTAMKVEGSVGYGNDYNATSTAANSVLGAQTKTEILLKTGQGSLGSVIVTGANTGVVNFYNATTSNVNLRKTTVSKRDY